MSIEYLTIGQLYSNEDIYKHLGVANAGGIRLSVRDKEVVRAVIMTSDPSLHRAWENPYHDRLEGPVLTYTAAGKFGQQTLAGVNNRLKEQQTLNFPIHGFSLIASRRDRSVGMNRWRYLGLLEYLRQYPDTQLDADGKVRKVWLFEFKIHDEREVLPLSAERDAAAEILIASRLQAAVTAGDDEIVYETDQPPTDNLRKIEEVRGKLLAMEPRMFEFFVRNLLVHCGFRDVCVTKFSSDGGIDVNARAGARIWIFEDTLVQVQAKRWLHSVGRKEVAELRGSMQPFARGAVLTTSHFSRAAILEANELGKNPIALVDGFRLSKAVLDEGFQLNT
jgi:hypothetical protein